MDVLTSERRWAFNNEIKKQVTSSWSLFIQLFNIQNITLYDRVFVFMLNVNNGEKITYIFTIILFRDGTLLGTTSTLRLGQPRIPGSILANRGRVISFYDSDQTSSGVHPVSCSLGSEWPPDVKRPMSKADQSSPFIAELRNKCSCNYTPPFDCVAGIGTTVQYSELITLFTSQKDGIMLMSACSFSAWDKAMPCSLISNHALVTVCNFQTTAAVEVSGPIITLCQ